MGANQSMFMPPTPASSGDINTQLSELINKIAVLSKKGIEDYSNVSAFGDPFSIPFKRAPLKLTVSEPTVEGQMAYQEQYTWLLQKLTNELAMSSQWQKMPWTYMAQKWMLVAINQFKNLDTENIKTYVDYNFLVAMLTLPVCKSYVYSDDTTRKKKEWMAHGSLGFGLHALKVLSKADPKLDVSYALAFHDDILLSVVATHHLLLNMKAYPEISSDTANKGRFNIAIESENLMRALFNPTVLPILSRTLELAKNEGLMQFANPYHYAHYMMQHLLARNSARTAEEIKAADNICIAGYRSLEALVMPFALI